MREVITVNAFAEKIAGLYNATHGTEWHAQSAGYTRAKVWAKGGEVRVYVGSPGNAKTYLKIVPTNDGVGMNVVSPQYNFKDLIVGCMKAVAEEFKPAGLLDEVPVTAEGLAARYGWSEVIDAQNDVAREDFDI